MLSVMCWGAKGQLQTCRTMSDSRTSKPHVSSLSLMHQESISTQQCRSYTRNKALYNPINPTSFCAGCYDVTLMPTRCAALRDGPGAPHHSKGLMFYIALHCRLG